MQVSDLQRFPKLATGQLDAWIAITSSDRARINKLLPDDSELSCSTDESDQHPLIFLAGAQSNVTSRFLPWSLDYLEAGILVPSVRITAAGTLSNAMFRAELLLNRALPTFLGRLLGVHKVATQITRECQYIEVTSRASSEKVFCGRFHPTGSFERFSQRPEFKQIRPLLSQVHVGRALDSRLLPNVLIWCNLHLRTARVRPVAAEFHVDETVCAAKSGNFEVPPIDGGGVGAFQLRTEWSMRCLQ